MSKNGYFVPWAKTVARSVAPRRGFPKKLSGEYVERVKRNPDLLKRWSEKSAVTKRAQSQKVSLAPVPSLNGGARKDDHDSDAAASDVSARLEVSRHEG